MFKNVPLTGMVRNTVANLLEKTSPRKNDAMKMHTTNASDERGENTWMENFTANQLHVKSHSLSVSSKLSSLDCKLESSKLCNARCKARCKAGNVKSKVRCTTRKAEWKVLTVDCHAECDANLHRRVCRA